MVKTSWPKYKFDLKKCLTKVTSISKLHIILLEKYDIVIFNKKMQFSNINVKFKLK